MGKEKKYIKCGYAVLVIILFATVCFLTDYILISRNIDKCNCPKCENTCTKCDVKQESSVVEESNEHVSEIEYTFSSFSGKYVSNDGDKYTYINFSNDGSWDGYFNYCEGYTNFNGKYVVNDDMIFMKLDESSNSIGLTVPDVIIFKIVAGTSQNPTLIKIDKGFGCVYSDSKFSYSYGE